MSRLPQAVDELIAAKPDLLVGIEQVARVMKSKMATIPIIVSIGSDPVVAGLAQLPARPGGNVTGMSQLNEMIAPKLVELIVAALPRSRSITMFIDPSVPSAHEIERNVRAAAAAMGVGIGFLEISGLAALDAAFERLRRSPPDALLAAAGSGMLFGHRQLIAERALQLKIPVAGSAEAQAAAGFLFAYGPDLHALQRDAAGLAARVLRGASPASMPFQQATRFELVLNLKTATALGIELPRDFLLRADRTICGVRYRSRTIVSAGTRDAVQPRPLLVVDPDHTTGRLCDTGAVGSHRRSFAGAVELFDEASRVGGRHGWVSPIEPCGHSSRRPSFGWTR